MKSNNTKVVYDETLKFELIFEYGFGQVDSRNKVVEKNERFDMYGKKSIAKEHHCIQNQRIPLETYARIWKEIH